MSKTDILIPSPTHMQYHANHTPGVHINHPPHLTILHPLAHPRASHSQVPPPFHLHQHFTYIDFCVHTHGYFGPTPPLTFLFPQPTSLASQHWSPGVLSALLEWPAGLCLTLHGLGATSCIQSGIFVEDMH